MYDVIVQRINAFVAKLVWEALRFVWTAFVTILPYVLPYILIICAILALHIFIAKLMEKTAKLKGHKKSHAFAMCFWFGIFGYIYVACLPDLKLQQLQDISCAILTNKEEIEETVKS